MILYHSRKGHHTHIVDETTRGESNGPEVTLCNLETGPGGDSWESGDLPGCKPCLKELRRLQAEADARSEPLPVAPMPLVDEYDYFCPVCGDHLRLGAKRYSFPTDQVGVVRVNVTLICSNADGHREES